jgi:hypothetical protein
MEQLHPGVKMLLITLIKTIPGMTNVALLLFLMYCIYACWGMQLFAKTKATPGGLLDDHLNFQSFGKCVCVRRGEGGILTCVRACMRACARVFVCKVV